MAHIQTSITLFDDQSMGLGTWEMGHEIGNNKRCLDLGLAILNA